MGALILRPKQSYNHGSTGMCDKVTANNFTKLWPRELGTPGPWPTSLTAPGGEHE